MGTSIAQEILVPRAVSPKAETEALTPQQRYQQEMERIWERVNQLPDGQKRVVMHQLVQFGKLPLHPSPQEFPALATHGFILEQSVDGQSVWQPSIPHLKDFGSLGISSSFHHGYSLHPRQAFQGNLHVKMQTMPRSA
jgi:hypothetical protein